jgi:ketosteroid isomerase-like protein
MPTEDNKAAVRRFYQAVINGRNLDALDELLTPDGSTTPSAARTPTRPSSSSARSTRPSRICTPRSTT